MWFLLIQIFILMLLAAALGAALAWWWLSRRHEDLAASRERLVMQASRIDALATREDLEKELGSVSKLLASQKQVDLQPIEERLLRLQYAISEFRVPETDLRPLDERLSRLERTLAEAKPAEVDFGPVHSGIASLGIAVNALEPVNGRIAQLDTRLSEMAAHLEGMRRNDMDTIAGRFANISSSLAGLRMPDMAPVQSRLGELQAAVANIPPPDLAPVRKSLADIETFVVALDKPPQDFGPLHQRFAALESALMSVQAEIREAKALQPLDLRLAGLEEALGSMPGPDLDPVIGVVRSIDSRNDLVAVENRLTAIEYGLAAVHHMLRSRTDGDGRAGPPLQVVRDGSPLAAALRPARDADPINFARRPDDRANLLAEPSFGSPDDLEQIDGVGPMLRALLHEIGVFYFWQVAEWTSEEIDWVESKLKHFRGRIRRDDWVGHARALATAPTASKRPMQQQARGTF